jgi:hypothetical protein
MRGVYLGNGKIKGLDGNPYLVQRLEQQGFRQGEYVEFDPAGELQWVAIKIRKPMQES